MKSTDAFPSKFLSAADLQGREAIVKITHVATDEIGGKQKFICYFAGKQKGLVLNKTNWNNIVKITGQDDSDDWTGATVCLYETMVDFQGESVPAVRVKAPPKSAQKPRPSSAEMGRDDDFPGDRPTPRAQVRDDMNDEIGF